MSWLLQPIAVASVSDGAVAPGFPLANLLDPRPKLVWRRPAEGAPWTDALTIDLGADVEIDTLALLFHNGGAAGLLDAETNARYGMKYLAQAYRLAGGDTCRTVMMYQSGHMAKRMSGANRVYCSKVRTITASN